MLPYVVQDNTDDWGFADSPTECMCYSAQWDLAASHCSDEEIDTLEEIWGQNCGGMHIYELY